MNADLELENFGYFRAFLGLLFHNRATPEHYSALHRKPPFQRLSSIVYPFFSPTTFSPENLPPSSSCWLKCYHARGHTWTQSAWLFAMKGISCKLYQPLASVRGRGSMSRPRRDNHKPWTSFIHVFCDHKGLQIKFWGNMFGQWVKIPYI
ncbi:hypothetical protein I7I48_08909 [Histoplasma ohiense]|nr:hypothetical protein I7I48_08909 [Histoplasma ohiense (nom. inval.)]